MSVSSTPAVPEREKTLQELLDALTRPNKWAADPVAGAENLWRNDATWTAGVMTDGAASDTSPRLTGTQLHHEISDVTTSTFSTLPGGNVTRNTDFWYKYGISITVAILFFVVIVVLIIQCRMVYFKRVRRRRLVDFAANRSKAREEIFESFHRQSAAESVSRSRLQSATTHDEIPMRVLYDIQPSRPNPCHGSILPPARCLEPLAKVYPIHHEPSWDRNANITDPYPCDTYRRLWNTSAGFYPIRSQRTVLSEPAIARPSSRRYSSRSRVRRVQCRGNTRLPRFNLSGRRIVTSPESHNTHNVRNKPVRRNKATFVEGNANTLHRELSTPTPKLVVPTNTPNTHCTDSAQENASPYGPGLDSDFGASAGIPHFTVSPDNSMNVTTDTTSLRDATYEWDTYDPAYMNRTVHYVDGAYFPVLHRKQYWV